MRLLWLTYERSPHPDAVCHPITEEDAAFVIALLQQPYRERLHLTEQLACYLKEQRRAPPANRTAVACRTPGGLYRSVPWRLAKWLRHVLPAPDSVLANTITRIEEFRTSSSIELQSLSARS